MLLDRRVGSIFACCFGDFMISRQKQQKIYWSAQLFRPLFQGCVIMIKKQPLSILSTVSKSGHGQRAWEAKFPIPRTWIKYLRLLNRTRVIKTKTLYRKRSNNVGLGGSLREPIAWRCLLQSYHHTFPFGMLLLFRGRVRRYWYRNMFFYFPLLSIGFALTVKTES